MIAPYLAGLFTGGLLLVLSLAGGGPADDVETEVAGNGDVETHVEVEGDADVDADDGAHTGPAPWWASTLPVLSIRFWTFLLTFGGLAGLLLTAATPLGAGTVAALAAGVGYAAGIGVTALVRVLEREQITSTLAPAACVGASGVVVLPLARGERGRVRVALENHVIDFDAETDEEALALAEQVVIYAVRDDGVVLVSATASEPIPPTLRSPRPSNAISRP